MDEKANKCDNKFRALEKFLLKPVAGVHPPGEMMDQWAASFKRVIKDLAHEVALDAISTGKRLNLNFF